MKIYMIILTLAAALGGISCFRSDNPLSPMGTSLMKYSKGQYLFIMTESNYYRWDRTTGNNVVSLLRTNDFLYLDTNYSPTIPPTPPVYVSRDERFIFAHAQKSAGYTNIYRYSIDGRDEKVVVSGSATMVPRLLSACPSGALVVAETESGNTYYTVRHQENASQRDVIGSNLSACAIPLSGKSVFYTTNTTSATMPVTNTYWIMKYDIASKTTVMIATSNFTYSLFGLLQMYPSPDGDNILYDTWDILGSTRNTFIVAAQVNAAIKFISTNAPSLFGFIWSPYAAPLYQRSTGSGYEYGKLSTNDGSQNAIKTYETTFLDTKWQVVDAFGKGYLVNTNLSALGPAEGIE